MTWLAWACIVVGALMLAACIGSGMPAEWVREVISWFRRKPEPEPEPVETEWARQMRELNETLNQVLIAYGKALKPIFEEIVEVFNDITKALESGSEDES